MKNKIHTIEIENNDTDISPLNLGMISSYHYIQYTSIELYASSLNANTKLRPMLQILSASSEYETLQMRHGDDKKLRLLTSHEPTIKVNNPEWTEPYTKVNVLLQGHFSRVNIRSIDFKKDQEIILSDAVRLARALVDVISSNGWFRAVLIAMELGQMVVQGQWGTDSPLLQIPHFDRELANKCKTAGVEGIFDISSYDTEAREMAFSNDGSKMFFIGDKNDKVFEFNLSCNWSVIDGACDDPITTSDGGKDILSSIESQTATAKQIAIHATTPVLNRMFWLRRHRSNDQLSNQNIRLNFSNSMMASLSEIIPVSNKTNELLDKLSDEWSFWSEGSISFGRAGDTSHSSSKKIDSKGVSFGMDKKISENKLYGYAFRYGRDEVDVGSFGTTLDTDSVSLSLYGTFPQDDERFIEGILGVSKLKTDHVRKGGGNTRTGNRNGSQVFGSINYFTTYQKEKFNISPNIRIDLSYTELSKYSETGVASLVYNKQVVETGMISSGFNLSNIIDYNSLTFEPNAGLEFSLDFSPTSDATYRYISQTTEYTRGIGQDSKSIRGNIGFDLEMDNGLSLMTIYERNQSEIAHSDTLYIGFGYVPDESTEYAMKLDNNEATLNYKRNLGGFDINISSNYSLMSEIPEYGTNLELRNTF